MACTSVHVDDQRMQSVIAKYVEDVDQMQLASPISDASTVDTIARHVADVNGMMLSPRCDGTLSMPIMGALEAEDADFEMPPLLFPVEQDVFDDDLGSQRVSPSASTEASPSVGFVDDGFMLSPPFVKLEVGVMSFVEGFCPTVVDCESSGESSSGSDQSAQNGEVVLEPMSKNVYRESDRTILGFLQRWNAESETSQPSFQM